MKNKISIVVPVYNAGQFLDECLSSIAQQTYANIEVIVVYTQSQDDSLSVCEKYIQQDDRFKLVNNEENIRSAGYARNLALKVATGDYIGFVDSDDCIASNMYEMLVAAIEQNCADLAVCKETRKKSDLLQNDSCTNILNSMQAKNAFLIGGLFYGEVWNKLYRKQIISDLLFEKFSVAEDVCFVWRYLNRIQKLVYVDCPKYFYRMNPSGITHTFNETHYYDTIKVFSIIENDIPDSDRELKQLLATRRYLFYVQTFLNIKSVECTNTNLEKHLRQQLKSSDFDKRQLGHFPKREQIVMRLFQCQPDIAFLCYKMYKIVNKRDE